MIEQALVFVENLAVVSALRNSTLAYPLVNAGHILGVALLVGQLEVVLRVPSKPIRSSKDFHEYR